VLLRNNKLLITLLSLVAATVVSAHPTMSDCNTSFVVRAVSPTSDVHARYTYVPETSQITEPFNSNLAAIGAEILKPPADFTDSQSPNAKTLPPVPAALFMVLTGFLCVSLVKDRRVWLAALAGLLWACQAGFQVIPQLASNISKHIQRTSPTNIALIHHVEGLCRLRSDIEGTQYIGLLRHLAGIPAGTMSLPPQIPASWYGANSVGGKFQQIRNTQYPIRNTNEVPQFAITHFSFLLDPVFICPASAAEQYTYFSPAFIFDNLPRGPPNFT